MSALGFSPMALTPEPCPASKVWAVGHMLATGRSVPGMPKVMHGRRRRGSGIFARDGAIGARCCPRAKSRCIAARATKGFSLSWRYTGEVHLTIAMSRPRHHPDLRCVLQPSSSAGRLTDIVAARCLTFDVTAGSSVQAKRHRDHLVAWDGRRRGENTTRSRARPVRPP